MALIGFMVLQGSSIARLNWPKIGTLRRRKLSFSGTFAVHPVSRGTLMYRLHKRFSALELESGPTADRTAAGRAGTQGCRSEGASDVRAHR